MKKSLEFQAVILSFSMGFFFVGCSFAPSFYRVTDLQTGRDYYSQQVDHLASGAVVLNDTSTNSVITLQNSQVKKISSDEYQNGLAAPLTHPSATAPVPTEAPASTPNRTNLP